MVWGAFIFLSQDTLAHLQGTDECDKLRRWIFAAYSSYCPSIGYCYIVTVVPMFQAQEKKRQTSCEFTFLVLKKSNKVWILTLKIHICFDEIIYHKFVSFVYINYRWLNYLSKMWYY